MNFNRYIHDPCFVAVGFLFLLVNHLSSPILPVEGWMTTTVPIRLHERPAFATITLQPIILLSKTRLEAKGKNKRRNRDKNTGEDGEEEQSEGKLRKDGRRSGRRRKSIDPNSRVTTKKKKPKPSRRGTDGTEESKPRVTLDRIQTKRCWLRLETKASPLLESRLPTPQARLPLDICLVEIQDKAWWKSQEEEFQSDDGEKIEKKKENNPYGTRVWPASLALAEFLSGFLLSRRSTTECMNGDTITTIADDSPSSYHVLEIGCGTGLVSMAAALCGAKAMATDVAPMTLRLLQQGWSDTCVKQRKHREKILAKQPPTTLEEGEIFEVTDGNLKMRLLDVSLSDPLPWPEIAKGQNSAGGQKRVLVASAVLYEESLAIALARCCFQACYQDGAWVILADDDTGLREGGRDAFEKEWDRLVANDSRKKKKKKSPWVRATVEQKTVFGWANKQVQLLHLNYPASLQFD